MRLRGGWGGGCHIRDLTVKLVGGVEHGGREECGCRPRGWRVEGVFPVTKSDSNKVSIIGSLDRFEPSEGWRVEGRVLEGWRDEGAVLKGWRVLRMVVEG